MSYYHVPPPGYAPYHYNTSTSTSPSPDERYDYYPPPQHHTSPTARRNSTSTKRHHVRTTSYTIPKVAEWQAPPGYPPVYFTAVPNHPPPPVGKYDYVSGDFAHSKTKARRFSMSGHGNSGGGGYSPEDNGNPKRRASVRRRSQTQHIYVDAVDDADDQGPTYVHIKPRTTYSRTSPQHYQPEEPLRHSHKRKPSKPKADNYFFFTQAGPKYEEPVDTTPIRSRARRSSTNTHPHHSNSTPPKPAAKVDPPPHREATEADAIRHKIPHGYSLKNWDPTEQPIVLLGSVFDANSLGKWIYDWTVYHHGPHSPIAEVAGEHWLLLIKFAGKMKRAKECYPRVRSEDNKEMLGDFYASGQRIWAKMKALLRLCEEPMWGVAKRERGKVAMGEKSGVEFVKSMFGVEREMERTEKLMTSVRLWNMRFDANCDPILREPKKR